MADQPRHQPWLLASSASPAASTTTAAAAASSLAGSDRFHPHSPHSTVVGVPSSAAAAASYSTPAPVITVIPASSGGLLRMRNTTAASAPSATEMDTLGPSASAATHRDPSHLSLSSAATSNASSRPILRNGAGGGAESDAAPQARGKRQPIRIPFAAVITAEIFLCCIVVVGCLLLLSYYNSKTATDGCLNQSEEAQSQLSTTIQDAVTSLVSQEIENIVRNPTSVIQETLRLYNQSLINVNNYEVLWKHFYYQLEEEPTVAVVYYGDSSYGDFVGVENIDYGTSDAVIQAEFVEASAAAGDTSRCPTLCPSLGVSTAAFYYLNLAESDSSVSAVSVNHSAVAVYNSSNHLVGILAADITFVDLRVQLAAIKAELSANAFIFVFSTNGELFATSVANETTSVEYTDESGTLIIRPKYTDEIVDQNTLAAARIINETYSNVLTNMTQNKTYTGSGLLFQHVLKQVGELSNASIVLAIVAGVPTKDYTGAIDVTRSDLETALTHNNQYMLSSAAAVAVVFMILTIPTTIVFVGRPMEALARNLEKVANYDFSALHSSQSEVRSRVKEIWTIQTAYWNMVRSFSRSIAANRKLMSRNAADLGATNVAG
ncbi:hypothetical protein HK405_003703 [Cladochytrium tenue]|nr:hypothetical protein HK405_003703 [Cladochytrium tenue]